MIYKKMIDDVTRNPTLREALEIDETLLWGLYLNSPFTDSDLIETFKGMYNNMQLGTSDLTQFGLWIDDKCETIRKYYKKKIEIYQRELNGDEGIKISRATSKTNSAQTATTNGLTSATNDTINTTNYDLARTSNPVEKPTTKQTVSDAIQNTQNSTINSSGNGNESISETITGDVNVVEQRDKWLKFLRNIYAEMCKEFRDCFALVYA